jgi:hypothetical protein
MIDVTTSYQPPPPKRRDYFVINICMAPRVPAKVVRSCTTSSQINAQALERIAPPLQFCGTRCSSDNFSLPFHRLFACPTPQNNDTSHIRPPEDERRGAPSLISSFGKKGPKPSFRPPIRTASTRPHAVSSWVNPRSLVPDIRRHTQRCPPPSSLIRRTPSHPSLHPPPFHLARP